VSAVLRTVAISCSIDAAVSSRLAACSSVRWLRSALPPAISSVAVRTVSAAVRTFNMMRLRSVFTVARASMSRPTSSLEWMGISRDRSPSAMDCATDTAAASGRVMLSWIRQATNAPINSAEADRPMMRATDIL